MISRTAEYALRAVVYLGNQQGGLRTTAQISQSIDAPSDYLSKVLQGLSRAKIVRSQRGLHGGFSLAIDPDELTIFDVVQAVDVLQRYPQVSAWKSGPHKRTLPASPAIGTADGCGSERV